MTVRESPDELTLRAEEVGTWKTYINVDHIAKERWGPPLVDTDWHAFCQELCNDIEGEDCGELDDAYKEMSRTVGVKKPQEAQKIKALWEMKAAKDAGEEYYDPTRVDNILGRNKTILALWEEHLKDPIVALDKALKCVEILYLRSRPECLAEGCLVMAGVGFLQSLWEKPIWEGVWPCLDRWIVCVYAGKARAARRALSLPDSGASDSAGQ